LSNFLAVQDLLITVFSIGRVFASPLKTILEHGVPLENGMLVVAGRTATPEP
jgi:hypothetical protein